MSKYHNQNKMQPETNLSSYTIETTNTLIYQAMYPFNSNDKPFHNVIYSLPCLLISPLSFSRRRLLNK